MLHNFLEFHNPGVAFWKLALTANCLERMYKRSRWPLLTLAILQNRKMTTLEIRNRLWSITYRKAKSKHTCNSSCEYSLEFGAVDWSTLQWWVPILSTSSKWTPQSLEKVWLTMFWIIILFSRRIESSWRSKDYKFDCVKAMTYGSSNTCSWRRQYELPIL